METEKIIDELKELVNSKSFVDRGDYLDGVLDGLEMAIQIIEKYT